MIIANANNNTPGRGLVGRCGGRRPTYVNRYRKKRLRRQKSRRQLVDSRPLSGRIIFAPKLVRVREVRDVDRVGNFQGCGSWLPDDRFKRKATRYTALGHERVCHFHSGERVQYCRRFISLNASGNEGEGPPVLKTPPPTSR
jgi:hypothetical protein